MFKLLKIFALPLLLAGLSGCGGGGGSSPTPPRVCTVTGTSVNIGGTYGAVTWWLKIGDSSVGPVYINFNNIALNFTGDVQNVPAANIVDVGAVTCLEDIPAFPGGTTTSVAYKLGHGYSVKYNDGSNTTARFIANSYSGGVANITYQYPY